MISKRNFTYGKCLQGNIGLDTWALSVIFPRLRFAAERASVLLLGIYCHLECLAKGFVLAAFFFFFFFLLK